MNILNLKLTLLICLSKKVKSNLVKMFSNKYFNINLLGYLHKSSKLLELCQIQLVSTNIFWTSPFNIVLKAKILCISWKYGNKKYNKNKRKLDKKSLKFSNLRKNLWLLMIHTLRIKNNTEILLVKCHLTTKFLSPKIMTCFSLY